MLRLPLQYLVTLLLLPYPQLVALVDAAVVAVVAADAVVVDAAAAEVAAANDCVCTSLLGIDFDVSFKEFFKIDI